MWNEGRVSCFSSLKIWFNQRWDFYTVIVAFLYLVSLADWLNGWGNPTCLQPCQSMLLTLILTITKVHWKYTTKYYLRVIVCPIFTTPMEGLEDGTECKIVERTISKEVRNPFQHLENGIPPLTTPPSPTPPSCLLPQGGGDPFIPKSRKF